jgi:hypothetical protein
MAALAFKIFGGTFILSSSSMAAYTWQRRQENLSTRRLQLAEEAQSLTQQLQACQQTLETERKATAASLTAAQERLHIVENLWSDRLERYDAALATASSALEALPEATQVLAELSHHYQHMTTHMPAFIEFDALASRIHALGILSNASSNIRGIDLAALPRSDLSVRRNADVYRSLSHSDAVMEHVLRSVETGNPNDIPKSFEEVDTLFGRSRRYLSEAIEEFNRKAALAAEKSLEATATRTGDYIPFKPGTPSAAVKGLFEKLRIEDDTAEAPEVSQAKRKQKELEAYQLKNRQDVLAALVHIHELKLELAKANGAKWANDPHVARAVASLDVWSVGAQRFLADEMAHRVVKASAAVLSHALVAVDVQLPKQERQN